MLILGETLEFILPLAYLACFIVAYYGPNAEILGNVKNGYWTFMIVEDVLAPIQNLLLVLIVDVISFIAAVVFLHRKCNVNLIKIYNFLLQNYGLTFAIQIAFCLEHHFCTVPLGCAFDFTLKFDWVLDPEKWENITGIVQ